MAFCDDLATIRDNMVAELKAETARRAAIVKAGNPAPVTYTVKGRQQDWNGYVSAMLGVIADLNRQVIEAGGDGGVMDLEVRAYT